MKQLNAAMPMLMRPQEEWPKRTCTTCGDSWRDPRGGEAECDDCRDKREAAERAEHLRAEQEMEKKRRERWLAELRRDLPQHMSRSGVPNSYIRYTRSGWESLYGAWEDRPSTAEMIGWPWEDRERHPCDWLVIFYGPYGRRKTSMATSILSEAIARGLDCQWWDMNDYLEKLKLGIRREKAEASFEKGGISSWSSVPAIVREAEPYTDIKNRATDVDLLLMDDLGSIRGARSGGDSWWQEEITYLMRHRHAWDRATVVTTNGSIEALGAIDPSLVSRMDVRLSFDMDDGTDYRRLEAHVEPQSRNHHGRRAERRRS